MRLEASNVLVGREKESEVLKRLWHQVSSKKEEAPSQICLVHGSAGSGKTALILHAASNAKDNRSIKSLSSSSPSPSSPSESSSSPPYFISGKFDQYKDFSSPYSEIVSAFEQLATMAPPQRIADSLTTEARVLARLIPSFRTLLDEYGPEEQRNEESNNEIRESVDDGSSSILTMASERLIVAFQVFLREFCNLDHPVILFADDLQWSDENSCRLLGEIANDKSIHHFLFIGCYRDEGASNFDLAIEESRPVTDISIDPLEIGDVESLIGHMVRMSDSIDNERSNLSDLGRLVHRKTLGNAYFVVQFLETLHSRELIKFNYDSFKWEWDVDLISEMTDVSENVVDVLRTRIERLSPQVQRRLILAAFLGFFVQVELLQMLEESKEIMDCLEKLRQANAGETQSMTTLEALEKAGEEHLIEISDTGCRFSHDRIQECVYALVPAGPDQTRLHYLIGMGIWKAYADSNPLYLFLSADQLNRGASFLDQYENRLFLVELNFKAGLAAKKKIGAETVSMFIEKAIQGVHESHWEHSYEMLIDLHSFAAEVEFSRGNFEASEGHIQTVLRFAKHKSHTIRALVIRAQTHGAKRNFAQGIKECRMLLELLGVKIRKCSTLSLVLDNTKTKRALKNKDDNYFLQMKDMQSENMITAMRILQYGSVFGWNSDGKFAVLCYLQMIRIIIEHGWCEVTPYAFAGYGFLLAAQGQEKEAFRFSQLASSTIRSQSALPAANMLVHACLAHFERPAANSLPPLLLGYRTALVTGDIMSGSICMCNYAHVYFFSGLPIVSFAQDMKQFAGQLNLCHQYLALAFILPAWQLALNLSGQTLNPIDVSIESMKKLEGYNESMFVDTATTEDPTVLFMYYLQVFSGYLLGDLDLVENVLDRINARRARRLEGTQILNIFFALLDGLASVALWRVQPRRKYRRRAKIAVRELENLVKKRSINCAGVFSLLQAEMSLMSRQDSKTIKSKYDDAITQLTRSGFLHFAAIANEQAGRHMLMMNDDDWAADYFKRAKLAYSEWGATVKVERMVDTYSSVEFGNGCHGTPAAAFHGKAQYNSTTDSISVKQDNGTRGRGSFVYKAENASSSTEFRLDSFRETLEVS